ncbi:MAG: methyltransferase domain-containing protein [Ginsengibacter sp.]
MRKPFQGVRNIIRFNWHFYVLALGLIILIFYFGDRLSTNLIIKDMLLVLIIGSTLISLLVSTYIYDFSNLYKLSWLDKFESSNHEKIININAGFDETSFLLKSKFENCEISVLDFYDPKKHTEISIKRARKAYPPFPNTQQVKTTNLPLQDNSADKIFTILSAHEIRNVVERESFFRELRRALSPTGQIIVTEHLRDTANFLAYNIGAFHFHSKATWHKAFQSSSLRIVKEIKITPFITTFILDKNGVES